MDRKEIYAVIKENSLQDSIKEYFGRNYTNVSTNELYDFIVSIKTSEQHSCGVRNTLDKLVEVLSNKRILLKSEVTYIFN